MTSRDMAERAYVQSRLDEADHQLDAVIESMRTDLDRLRDSWAESYSAEREASEARLAAIREESAAFLRDFYDDGADEGAPADVGQSQAGASSPGPLAPASPGSGPGQPNSRDAAELAEAERIRRLPMKDWAEERQRLIRAGSPVMF